SRLVSPREPPRLKTETGLPHATSRYFEHPRTVGASDLRQLRAAEKVERLLEPVEHPELATALRTEPREEQGQLALDLPAHQERGAAPVEGGVEPLDQRLHRGHIVRDDHQVRYVPGVPEHGDVRAGVGVVVDADHGPGDVVPVDTPFEHNEGRGVVGRAMDPSGPGAERDATNPCMPGCFPKGSDADGYRKRS